MALATFRGMPSFETQRPALSAQAAPPEHAFGLHLQVVIRRCVAEDLQPLEWFGEFTPHREIIAAAFERHLRGENLMLVAVANGFPIGQLWIDTVRARSSGAGFIWAVRVLSLFQGLKIGAQLMAAAEAEIARGGFEFAELGVETWNDRALRFYETLGYEQVGYLTEEENYVTPEGETVVRPMHEILLRKRVNAPAAPVDGVAQAA